MRAGGRSHGLEFSDAGSARKRKARRLLFIHYLVLIDPTEVKTAT